MTDKELLELAAKAAGIKVPSKKDYPYAYINETGIHRDISCGGDGTRMSCWNPLIDDGAALRLAVAAGIRGYFGIEIQTTCSQATAFEPWEHCEYEEFKAQDPHAATRRAIVRAAAEIGKGMK